MSDTFNSDDYSDYDKRQWLQVARENSILRSNVSTLQTLVAEAQTRLITETEVLQEQLRVTRQQVLTLLQLGTTGNPIEEVKELRTKIASQEADIRSLIKLVERSLPYVACVSEIAVNGSTTDAELARAAIKKGAEPQSANQQ